LPDRRTIKVGAFGSLRRRPGLEAAGAFEVGDRLPLGLRGGAQEVAAHAVVGLVQGESLRVL